MKFSIITPTFNSEDFIKKNLQSIHNQVGDFSLEHIIVDGNSSDNTLNIIRDFKKETNYEIKIIQGEDKNMYDAINKGLKQVKGDVWSVLNSDDEYVDDILSCISKKFQKNNNLEVIHGYLDVIDENNNFIKRSYTPDFSLKDLINAEKCIFIAQPTTFLRKVVINKVGYFDINYDIASDYEYMIRVVKNCKIENMKKVITKFRRHNKSLSVIENDQNEESKNIAENYRKKFKVEKENYFFKILKYKVFNIRFINIRFIINKYIRKMI